MVSTSSTLAAVPEAEVSEVLRPPLCTICDMETARDTDDAGGAELVQACVDFVDSTDGGVAKLRWQMMNDSSIMDGKKDTCRRLQARRGTDTKLQAQRQEYDVIGESRELIWINVADPLNGPVFQPHPLKPVPTCMEKSAEI